MFFLTFAFKIFNKLVILKRFFFIKFKSLYINQKLVSILNLNINSHLD